jgi:hypothetical protein
MWQHLSYAGLIGGKYTGQYATSGQNDIGLNVPPSKFASNTGWFLSKYQDAADLTYTNLALGGFKANNNNSLKILSPAEAYNIDLKTDDGLPLTGLTRGAWFDRTYLPTNSTKWGGAAHAFGTSCAYGTTSLANTYNLMLTGPQCIILFTF